jgi:hypothetical protein
MFHFLKTIGVAVLGALTFLTSPFVKPTVDNQVSKVQNEIHSLQSQLGDQNLGAAIPKVVAVFETSLASKITSSATTMTLVSGTNKAGNSLSGYIGFVIDEGTASEEFVACTASGTSLTSCIRGIDPVDGDLEVSSLKLEHRRGASVKITNYPVLGVVTRILNGDETLPNKISYNSHPTFSSNTELIDKKYADDLAIAGAPDSSIITKGIVEQATKAETAAGTATGGTTAPLVVPNSSFSATFSATTTVPVTGTNGKLSSGFIDQTAAYTWSATSTFSGPLITSGLSTGVLQGNSGSSVTSIAPSTSGNHLVSNGSSWTSASPALANSSTTISTGGALSAAAFTVIATTTVTTNGFPVLLSAVGSWQNSGATNNNFLDFAVDGTRVGDSTGGLFSHRLEAASSPYSFNTSWIVPPLAAGSHIFTLLVKTSAGNVTIPSNSSKATFFAKELY